MRAALAVGLAFLLGLSPALPAAAARKPCSRLCREDTRTGRATCTGGTRRERRQCKRGCKVQQGVFAVVSGSGSVTPPGTKR